MGKRIGVLTGGGDCPGLNAVIRGIVKAGVLRRGWQVLGIQDGFEGLLGERSVIPLDLAAVRGILPRGGTILGTTNRGNPFAMPSAEAAGASRDRSGELLARFRSLQLDALVVIGGEGSLAIALQLSAMGIPVVGVPKTIDNDLLETDVTFGYNTALETATDALDKLHTTAESHHRVMIMEVMGRYAGWIAIEAGIAGGADVILIPEIPFDLELVCQAIQARCNRGSNFSIVVAAEGALPRGGQRQVKQAADARHAVERLGGIGEYVARELAACMELETRVMVLGHLQRGGSPSTFDRCLASRFGVKAVELVEQEEFGSMVALHGRSVVAVPIERAVSQLKLVDPDGELVRSAEELGIIFGR